MFQQQISIQPRKSRPGPPPNNLPNALPGIDALSFPLRPRSTLDRADGHSGLALGLGPAPADCSGSFARRFSLGLFGTLASVIWMWSLAPPPI